MFSFTITALLLATAVAAAISSSAQLEKRQFPGYTITSLGSRSVSGTGVRIQFAIHDGVAVDNTTKTCFGSFTPDTKGQIEDKQEPMPCLNSTGQPAPGFSWRLEKYTSLSSFTVAASHSYIDPSVGPCAVHEDGTTVICGTTTWARGDVTPEDLSCRTVGASGAIKVTRCQSRKDIHLEVYQAIA